MKVSGVFDWQRPLVEGYILRQQHFDTSATQRNQGEASN